MKKHDLIPQKDFLTKISTSFRPSSDSQIKKVHSEKSRFIEIENIKIHYQEFGDKNNPTLLLIHGYGTSAYTWHSTAPLLAESGFYVVALDLVGFGLSEKPRWFDYLLESQMQIVLNFMNLLHIKTATFIGSSYGGAIASLIALDEAERVEKLILVSSVCNNEIVKDFFVGILMKPYWGEKLSSVLIGSKTFFKLRLLTTFSIKNYKLIDNNYVEAIRTPLNTSDGQYAALATLRNWEAERIEQNASNIKHPTLLVWGENDKIVRPQIGKRLNELIKNSQLSIFKQCGHAPHEEYPENFVKLVKDFCDSKQKPGKQKKQQQLKKTKDFYDDIAPVYQLFFKFNGYSRSIEKYIRSIKTKLPTEMNFLDAGCGNGMMTSALYCAGVKPQKSLAVDISHNSLSIAKEEFAKNKKVNEKTISLVMGNILKLPFPDESFDVIGTCGVLEYVDLKEGFAELTRVLRPNGFIIFVPVRPSVLGKVLEKIYRFKTIYPKDIYQAVDKHFRVIDEYQFPITEPTGWSKKLFLLQKKESLK
jgi:pimeloyl-ACP methyl ester carboxylesterase/ubiquinone/menaquinone biosynthesis C-methylase UbiE